MLFLEMICIICSRRSRAHGRRGQSSHRLCKRCYSRTGRHQLGRSCLGAVSGRTSPGYPTELPDWHTTLPGVLRGPPGGASIPRLTQFVAWLHTEYLSSSTTKNYLAAIRQSQITLGLGDPKMGEMVQLEYVLRGAKRRAKEMNRPIMLEILEELKEWQHHPRPKDAVILWAAGSCG